MASKEDKKKQGGVMAMLAFMAKRKKELAEKTPPKKK
jgi:hypothetical protein